MECGVELARTVSARRWQDKERLCGGSALCVLTQSPESPEGSGANPKKPKGAATLSAAPHWITPGKNYLQGKGNLERTG